MLRVLYMLKLKQAIVHRIFNKINGRATVKNVNKNKYASMQIAIIKKDFWQWRTLVLGIYIYLYFYVWFYQAVRVVHVSTVCASWCSLYEIISLDLEQRIQWVAISVPCTRLLLSLHYVGGVHMRFKTKILATY